MMLKFIPERGRKRLYHCHHSHVRVVEFIPVRGRKRGHVEPLFELIQVEIYPREGTETRSAGLANHIRCHDSPREGIETRDVKTIKSSFFFQFERQVQSEGTIQERRNVLNFDMYHRNDK